MASRPSGAQDAPQHEHLAYFLKRISRWRALGAAGGVGTFFALWWRGWVSKRMQAFTFFVLGIQYIRRLRRRRGFNLEELSKIRTTGLVQSESSYVKVQHEQMSEVEAEINRVLLNALGQLDSKPDQRDPDLWGMSGNFGRFGSVPVGPKNTAFTSLRYHIAFSAYATALSCAQYTPAYLGPTATALRQAMNALLRYESWNYAEHYWPKTPHHLPLSCKENIMWTGHVLHVACLYEVITGDDRYRRPGGLVALGPDGQPVETSDVNTLAELIASVMDANESGGIACEPGLVFPQCQGHPQVAFRMLETLSKSSGKYKSQRQRWEHFCLKVMRSPENQPGALAILRHESLNLQAPLAHLGADAWALHYHAAFTEDPQLWCAIWETCVEPILLEFDTLSSTPEPGPHQGASCCSPLGIPSSVWVPALTAPAAQLGDGTTAAKLISWVKEHLLVNGKISEGPEWALGSTANFLQGLILAKNPRALRELTIGAPRARGDWVLDSLSPSNAAQVLWANWDESGKLNVVIFGLHDHQSVDVAFRNVSTGKASATLLSVVAGKEQHLSFP